MLDIGAGLGGWSIGFYKEEFRCTGVDLVDVGYPYALIIKDVQEYHPRPNYFDVVVASMPCTEFSSLTDLSFKKGQRGPREPEKGIELVRHAKRIIEEAEPIYWIQENVVGSIPYLEPILGKPMRIVKPWVLWGNLPRRMQEFTPVKQKDAKLSHFFENVASKRGNKIGLPEDFPFDPLRSWRRARIPTWLARSIAKQIREELDKRPVISQEKQPMLKELEEYVGP